MNYDSRVCTSNKVSHSLPSVDDSERIREAAVGKL